jgi:hypothetical protein
MIADCQLPIADCRSAMSNTTTIIQDLPERQEILHRWINATDIRKPARAQMQSPLPGGEDIGEGGLPPTNLNPNVADGFEESRPHPSPLPQERETLFPRLLQDASYRGNDAMTVCKSAGANTQSPLPGGVVPSRGSALGEGGLPQTNLNPKDRHSSL